MSNYKSDNSIVEVEYVLIAWEDYIVYLDSFRWDAQTFDKMVS